MAGAERTCIMASSKYIYVNSRFCIQYKPRIFFTGTVVTMDETSQEAFWRLPHLGLPTYHIRKANSDMLPYPEMYTL